MALDNEWMEVLFGTTDRCNINSCMTCPHKYRKFGEDASRELFSKISPFLKNVNKIGLQGFGESLANPDFMFFLKEARTVNPNIITGICTNGTLLDKHASDLVENGLNEVLISLDASNKQLYREIRQADFDSVLSGIKKIRDLDPNMHIGITMVLTKKNLHVLCWIIE